MTNEEINGEDIAQIPFAGKTILAQKNGKDYYVIFKRLCENMGIQYQAQYKRLKRQPWAVVSMTDTTGSDGKNYKMVVVNRKTMIMWLATIDSSRLGDPTVRDAVIRYQKQVADVLDAYFGKQADRAVAHADSDMVILSKAMVIATRKIKELNATVSDQQTHIAAIEPKAQLADDLTDKKRLVSLKEAASLLSNKRGINVGRQKLVRLMLDSTSGVKMLMREGGRLYPTSYAISSGWMKTKDYSTARMNPDGSTTPYPPKPMLTGKGLAHLYEKLGSMTPRDAQNCANADMGGAENE
jgi:anti-repressor protein